PAAAQRPDLGALDAYVARAVREWRVPGLAIAVVKGDSVVFEKGYGTRTKGRDEPVDEHTLFAVGSTTKAFTVAALSMLADSGRVAWDDPVTRHLPAFSLADPYVTREITVRDLVTHRTGVAADDQLWLLGYPRAEIVRRMRWLPRAAGLRSEYAYNNNMFVVAGEVVGAASGSTWDAFVARRIYAPLAMAETFPTLAAARARPNLATPHDLRGDTVAAIPYRDIDNVGPAGSMMSSAHDMARWLRFQLDSARLNGRRLVSARQHAAWTTPQFVVPLERFYPAARAAGTHLAAYGLGWFLQDYRGRLVAMHTGSIDGMSAIVGMLPEEGVGVVVLANLDHAEVRHALMYRVFDLYLGAPERDWSAELRRLYAAAGRQRESVRVTGTRPTLPLARYAGTYADSLYGDLRVRLEGGRLVAALGPRLAGTLEHRAYDTFAIRWSDAGLGESTVTFSLDARGTVAAATVDGRPFARAAEPAASDAR
ncbi:MAG TPA: serine hydrolase, partial [Longimicrobium sp.]